MRVAALGVVGMLLVLMGAAVTDAKAAGQTAKTDRSSSAQTESAAKKDDAPTWLADISKAKVPQKPAVGKIHGEPFAIDRAELQGGVLSLRQGTEFFADLEFKLFLFIDSYTKLENQFLDIFDEENPPTKTVPHVYIGWKPDSKSLPKTKSWTGDYLIHLKFGQMKNHRLPGEIYLCLPDMKQSFVAGTFDAIVK
jgi:hypothetical protein